MGTKRKLKASNPIPLLYGEGNSGTEWGGGGGLSKVAQ